MDLRKFIKHFTWREQDRNRITLGANTRLNPITNKAQLGTYGTDTYPTDDDLYVKSWIANPTAVKQWLGFYAVIDHKTVNNSQVTSAGFRLGDGTDQYYWDGDSWEIDTTNWNTEAEIANNITTFPVTERKLQVIVNLSTTDETETPELEEIVVAYSALLDSEEEDIVLRSVIRNMTSNVSCIARFPVTMQTTGTTLDLDGYPIDVDYNIIDVDSVFNHDTDSEHDTDILDSYDSGTKVITLTGSVNTGVVLWIRLIYRPIIASATSRDWYEVEHIPQIILENVTFLNAIQLPGEDFCGNKSDGSAIIVPGPIQGDLFFTLRCVTDKLVDHYRLSNQIKRYFANNKIIVSTGLDERYRLWLVEEFEEAGTTNENDLHSWVATFRVMDFCVWAKDSEDGYLVQNFNLVGDIDAII